MYEGVMGGGEGGEERCWRYELEGRNERGSGCLGRKEKVEGGVEG